MWYCRLYQLRTVRALHPPPLATTVSHKLISRRPIHCINISKRTLRADTNLQKLNVIRWKVARTFVNAQIASYLTPPAVFIGLLLTLWVYKCLMMVIFQNKIIYMPSVPPFSRRETIESYLAQCAPIRWREERIRSLDGTKISLCQGNNHQITNATFLQSRRAPIYILYFQGNASSLPPRLPLLSNILKGLSADTPCTIIALSYRGFWTSSGSPSQSGIEKDASAAFNWVKTLRDSEDAKGRILFWGQSIGSGVALKTAVKHSTAVDGLILETPFLSLKQMLISMYPQRWLPYRYLWPFLRGDWDSELSLRALRKEKRMPMLMMTAEKDEVVPADQGEALLQLATDLQFSVSHVGIRGALHHEALLKPGGKQAVIEFVRGRVSEDRSETTRIS